jgi:DNA-binding CsgD family transcriptional regulator
VFERKSKYEYVYRRLNMSFGSGYLTPREVEIWQLRRLGFKQIDIAAKLGIHRQGVNRSIHNIDSKIGQALNEAAAVHKLDIWSTDLNQGIIEAYSQALGVPAIISFTESNGVQVWYMYKGNCSECNRVPQCRAMLLKEAEERGIILSSKDQEKPPSMIAHMIFSTYSKIVELE